MMLPRERIVGRRIVRILEDCSGSDAALNYCDFLFQTDHGHCFRMPVDDGVHELLPEVVPDRHRAVRFSTGNWWRDHRILWWARIVDILVRADPDRRYPDAGVIALSSGWYLMKISGVPVGIAPDVFLVPKLPDDECMVSVWAARRVANTPQPET